MMLKTDGKMIFQGVQTRKTKTGGEFSLVKLADPEAYETHDFFKRDSLFVDNLEIGDEVTPLFQLNKIGYKTQTDLVAVQKYNG